MMIAFQKYDAAGVPRGIRTPVTAVKGRCPRPLDDGDEGRVEPPEPYAKWWSQPGSNRRPLACHASALPAELWPRVISRRCERRTSKAGYFTLWYMRGQARSAAQYKWRAFRYCGDGPLRDNRRSS